MEEKILRTTIGILSGTCDKDDIENLIKTSDSLLREHISNLSIFNLETELVMSKIAEITRDCYLENAYTNGLMIDKYGIPSDLLDPIGQYIDMTVDELNYTISNIIGAGIASDGELDIYNLDSSGSEAQYKILEGENPALYKYFSAKEYLVELLGLLSDFVKLKNEISQRTLSSKNAILIHMNLITKAISKKLRTEVNLYNEKKIIKDSAVLALSCYNHYGWEVSSDADELLTLSKNEIKEALESL